MWVQCGSRENLASAKNSEEFGKKKVGEFRRVFLNTCVLHLHYFKRTYINLHEFQRCFLRFCRQVGMISTLLTGGTLIKIQLMISVDLKYSRGETAKSF